MVWFWNGSYLHCVLKGKHPLDLICLVVYVSYILQLLVLVEVAYRKLPKMRIFEFVYDTGVLVDVLYFRNTAEW